MSVSLSVLILVQGRCMLTANGQGFVPVTELELQMFKIYTYVK